MRIYVLALNGVFDTGLAAVLDAFDTANVLAEMTGISSLRFRTKVVGLRKTITTAQGLSMSVTMAARAHTPDAVVMPAVNRIMPEQLVQALASGEVREAGAVLRKWSRRGALTADRVHRPRRRHELRRVDFVAFPLAGHIAPDQRGDLVVGRAGAHQQLHVIFF